MLAPGQHEEQGSVAAEGVSAAVRIGAPEAFPFASALFEQEGLVRQSIPYGTIVHAPSKPDLNATTPVVMVVGAFDGLHAGHRHLVRHALADARSSNMPCVALTFDPDPAEVVGLQQPLGQRLLAIDDRVAGLLQLGVDYVLVLTFTPGLASYEPARFVGEVLLSSARPASVHVGTNFRFGHKGTGTIRTLQESGDKSGFAVYAHELLSVGSQVVSATGIRRLLAQGKLSQANELLHRCHYVRGTVVHGRGEATSFGFPTANVRCDPKACLPAEGVYACYVVCDGSAWPAAANVGAPPTFSCPDPAFLEANLLGFSGDLYGAFVSVSFVQWLRASRVFDSLEELERTVLSNIAWVNEHLGHERIEVRV